MFGWNQVVWWHNHNWRYYIRFIGFYSWFSAAYFWTSSYIVKFAVLHWPYICWSTKFRSWQWYSSYSTWNCHHQVIYCKLNLKIEHPPRYECLVLDFKRVVVNAIITAINQVDWKFMFSNKNVHQQVNIFNKTIINIFSNFIPNKLVTFDDKDHPWMTEKLKEKIK